MRKLENKHKIEVTKLNKLELELLNLILREGSESIMNLFNDWQEQRNICNELYNKYLEEIMNN